MTAPTLYTGIRNNSTPEGSTLWSATLQDDGKVVESRTVYGLRSPDGTIQWNRGGDAFHTFSYEAVANAPLARDSGEMQKYLTTKAKAANINPEDYIAGHDIVSRIITFTATEPTTK